MEVKMAKIKTYLVRYSKRKSTVGGQTGGGWINMRATSIPALKRRAKREGIRLLKIKQNN